ncbi:glycoside hydrolase family 78 protein [Sphaerobolus stellatus SS14]|nr:glycoside hydrolase family 78 protein [Sphaerobolus stellatus SS14]
MFPSAIERSRLLEIAESNIPGLTTEDVAPIGTVHAVKSESAKLGWEAVVVPGPNPVQSYISGQSVIFNFENHFVGYLSFEILACPREGGRNPCRPDSPARIRIVFGEVLPDVCEDFVPFTGWLSQAWLPEETLIIDHFPTFINHPRRHAFRYVKFEVIATSIHFAVQFQNVKAKYVSSVPSYVTPLQFNDVLSHDLGLSLKDRSLLQRIDEVALRTLRNCMQTVYEDGPRRDRRLWIGDVRLQALANYETFKDIKLAKRCYYLFASLPADNDGQITACVFEKPTPVDGGDQIVDYSLLFANCVYEYVKFSEDLEAGRDLYPMARKQLEFIVKNISLDGIYNIPDDKSWHFIDWCDKLDRTTAEHCVLISSLRALVSLEGLLSYPPSTITIQAFGTLSLSAFADRLVATARENLYDKNLGVFVSGVNRQISWASNTWAVLAGLHRSKEEGSEIMKGVYVNENAVKAVTPYLHHYLVAAFLEVGLRSLALEHIKTYWGSMIAAGADTFFEAWDPERPRLAIYEDFHLQSFCHAWSCTPALLFRQMGFT